MSERIWTSGVDHVGLTVGDLGASRDFFCGALGWSVVGERPEYPASFVSDGVTRVTLWRAVDPEAARPFDRKHAVGLHHLALKVTSLDALRALYRRLADWPGVASNSRRSPRGLGQKST
ncbi:VOC family protein [Lacibacterium aquatile]|uniref:VOC family protein n=1 Tax=Lacibacterium aquatile TaxID=1168082 RepID=A0ABW5DS37_9PROT